MGSGAAPAGKPRKLALGRPRDPARAALRPLCEVLAARTGSTADNARGREAGRKRGPGACARQERRVRTAMERRKAQRAFAKARAA